MTRTRDEIQGSALRRRVYEIVDVTRGNDPVSTAFDLFMVALILANAAAFILETVPSIKQVAGSFFLIFEVVSVLIFTAEYLVRLWSCTADSRFSRPVRGRVRFAMQPLLLVDLLAVLPAYLPLLGVDLRFVRTLRILRIIRLAKLGRYTNAMQMIWRVLRSKREELLTTVGLMLLLLLFAAVAMYYAERHSQPDVFGSIPESMWWAIVTLTTVGYGDTYPITTAGRMIGAVIAMFGIGMFALPAGMLGAAFVEEIGRGKRMRVCPHCGERLDE